MGFKQKETNELGIKLNKKEKPLKLRLSRRHDIYHDCELQLF